MKTWIFLVYPCKAIFLTQGQVRLPKMGSPWHAAVAVARDKKIRCVLDGVPNSM